MASQWQEIVDRWAKDGPVTANGAVLQYQLSGGGSVDVAVDESNVERVTLTATWTPPGWLSSVSEGVLPGVEDLARSAASLSSALLTCESGNGGVEITMPVFLEGLSRQSFTGAVAEIARAYSSLEGMAAALDSSRSAIEESERGIATAQAVASETQRAVESIPVVETPTAETGWAPTHRIPAEGLDARARPQPTDKVVARLDPWLEVSVSERQGDWAHIVCSNEWSAWVDGRKLEPK